MSSPIGFAAVVVTKLSPTYKVVIIIVYVELSSKESHHDV